MKRLIFLVALLILVSSSVTAITTLNNTAIMTEWGIFTGLTN